MYFNSTRITYFWSTKGKRCFISKFDGKNIDELSALSKFFDVNISLSTVCSLNDLWCYKSYISANRINYNKDNDFHETALCFCNCCLRTSSLPASTGTA